MGSPFPSSSWYPACLAGPLPAFPHATVGILHFISSHTHSGCGPQSASFGGKRDFALSCAGSSVNCVCSYRPTWAQVQETWEIKQNHSSRFQFCLPYHHHRGVSGKGSQCFPKTPENRHVALPRPELLFSCRQNQSQLSYFLYENSHQVSWDISHHNSRLNYQDQKDSIY